MTNYNIAYIGARNKPKYKKIQRGKKCIKK